VISQFRELVKLDPPYGYVRSKLLAARKEGKLYGTDDLSTVRNVLDSLELVELVMCAEEEGLPGISTVDDLLSFLELVDRQWTNKKRH
jgi:hypothetical protein